MSRLFIVLQLTEVTAVNLRARCYLLLTEARLVPRASQLFAEHDATVVTSPLPSSRL